MVGTLVATVEFIERVSWFTYDIRLRRIDTFTSGQRSSCSHERQEATAWPRDLSPPCLAVDAVCNQLPRRCRRRVRQGAVRKGTIFSLRHVHEFLLKSPQYGTLFDVRWPSKKFKSTRRFCYVQYTSPVCHLYALNHGLKLTSHIELCPSSSCASWPGTRTRDADERLHIES